MDEKQTISDIPVRYSLRLATSDDLPYIVEYFKSNRPETVFERTQKAFRASIENGLMWLLTDPQGEIIATAAVHILPTKMGHGGPTASLVTSIDQPQPLSFTVNVAELGSVWRKGNEPAGFVLDLLYSACILQTYAKAKALIISNLVTQVVAKNAKGIDKLLELQQGWESYLLDAESTQQFKRTIADSLSREMVLSSFYAPVRTALSAAARCLLGLTRTPKFSRVPRLPSVIKARDERSGKDVEIDLGTTTLISFAERIISLSASQNMQKDIPTETILPWFASEHQVFAPTPTMHRRRKRPVQKFNPPSAQNNQAVA